MIVEAGPVPVLTSAGVVLHCDHRITRETADLVHAAIRSAGLTPEQVMAVEFRGEAPPILTTLDPGFQMQQIESIRHEQQEQQHVHPTRPTDSPVRQASRYRLWRRGRHHR